MEKLHLTFGSSYVVEDIKKQNSTKKFLQFSDEINPQQHALITIDNEQKFFKSNLNYSILSGNLDIIKKKSYFFNHFSLDEKQQKMHLTSLQQFPNKACSFILCQSLKYDFDFLIISCWTNISYYREWLSNHNFVSTPYDSSNSFYSKKMHIDL
ncbi:hypothetical protein [Liquorilactobacillus hordei]|uniref:hypothetical protein n=1 Tax=Liquorilactobacillus hordei TaxID=468911 RepID=UPI001CBCAE76|nr:hypothetical protein [Liquorilactobacillus hordei]MBZ2405447.1 hypothetical protein [Liquorilactobacillus hordei]